MPQFFNENDQTLIDSLKQFLNLQSNAQPITQYCDCCGSVCMHLPTKFWLEGDEQSFTICLPFCADCNPELFARIPAVA